MRRKRSVHSPGVVTDAMVRELMAKSKWVFAKSMPQFPHEYTSVNFDPVTCPDHDLLIRVATHITENGYVRYFFSRPIRYVNCDGYCLWHMGVDTSIGTYNMLNRAKLPNISPRFPGKPNLDAQSPIRSVRRAAGVTDEEEQEAARWLK